jgi:hypothetical protein
MDKPLTIGCWTIALLIAGAASAYSADAEPGGQGEIAFQGYYLGTDSSPLIDITGAAANFRTFFPGLGLLRGNLETYGGQGQFRAGYERLQPVEDCVAASRARGFELNAFGRQIGKEDIGEWKGQQRGLYAKVAAGNPPAIAIPGGCR